MRLVIALLTCILVPTTPSAPVAAAPSAETHVSERAQRPRVTLSASPTWVRKGRVVTLRGAVTGVRGRATVTIFQRNKGSRRWVVEAVRRTNRKGRFTHREDVNSGDRTYKACVRRACDSVVVHMGKRPPQPPAEPKPTAVSVTAVSSPSVEAGQAFTVGGTASGNLEGRAVVVQAYDGASSTWSAVGQGTVQGAAWSAAATLTTAGRAVPLRAVFPGGVGLEPSSSTAITMTVFGWYYLDDLDTVQGYWDYEGALRISGVTYPKSVSQNSVLVQVDLQRACTRFTAAVGLDDSSGSTERSSVRLLADSVERYANANLALGAGYPVSFDLTGALRLVFQASPVNGDPQIVLGDARVLCAF